MGRAPNDTPRTKLDLEVGFLQGNDERKRIAEHLKELFEEEISEAGSRMVMAIIAEREGFSGAASVLREVANDEAKHAFLIAEFLPEPPFRDTKANLQGSLEGDSDAARRESEFARSAREAGMEKVAELLERLSAEETDHVAQLRESLEHLTLQVVLGFVMIGFGVTLRNMG